jgi:hypothetical protein
MEIGRLTEEIARAKRRFGFRVLFLALELGRREWKLGFATAIGNWL